MRKLLLTICVTSLSMFTVAQFKAADSLRQLLQQAQTDTSRMVLMAELSQVFLNRFADSSLYYGQSLLEYGKGRNNYMLNFFALNNIAMAYQQLGNQSRALEILFDLAKLCEEKGDLRRLRLVLVNISNFYAETGDHREAIRYLQRVLETPKQEPSKIWGRAWLNMGDSYEKLDVLDSARLYTVLASEEARKNGDTETASLADNNLGNIYYKMGELDIALGYYRAAMQNMMRDNFYYGMAETALGLAKVYQKKGINDSVLYYAQMSFNVSRKANLVGDVLRISTFLADYFKSRKNADSAYKYLEIVVATKDTLYSTERTNQVQNLLIEERLRQQKIEADKAKQKAEREQNIQYAIIAITLLSFLILFLVLSRSIIVNEKWIKYMGVLGLLLVFEFVNLVLHPVLAEITHHSPVWMLLFMVAIAAILIPMHHRVEHFIRHRLTVKNKKLRLETARKIVAQLEKDEALKEAD
jgi:Tfp pilus assembly protein PilF